MGRIPLIILFLTLLLLFIFTYGIAVSKLP